MKTLVLFVSMAIACGLTLGYAKLALEAQASYKAADAAYRAENICIANAVLRGVERSSIRRANGTCIIVSE